MNSKKRIGALNSALKRFCNKVSRDRVLRKNIYVSINTFNDNVNLNEPELGERIKFNELEASGGTNIKKAILGTIDQITKWKNQLQNEINPNFIYLILVTDDESIKENAENTWIKNIQNFSENDEFKFEAIGVDNANLSIIEQYNNPNIHTSNNLNFEECFQGLVKELKEKFPPLWHKKNWRKLKAIGNKIDGLLKISFTLIGITGISFTGFGISFISISLIGGVTLLSVTAVKNINFYTTNNKVKDIRDEANQELESYLKNLKIEEKINEKTTIETQIELNRGKGIKNFFFPDRELELTYTFIDSLENYILGKYRVNSSWEISTAAGFLVHFFEKYIYPEFSIHGHVDLFVTGVTDAAPVTKKLIYKGEYGSLQNEKYIYKDTLKEIKSLQKEAQIGSNEILGFLRAYAFGDFLRRKLDVLIEKETTYLKFVETNEINHGGKYRKVVVIIRMKKIRI